MTNGPVPSGTYDLIRDVQDPNRQSLWAEHARSNFALKGWNVVPFRDADETIFSSSEIESFDWAISTYGAIPVKNLIDISHDEPAYKDADFNGDISVEAIAKTLPDSEALLEHLRQPELETA